MKEVDFSSSIECSTLTESQQANKGVSSEETVVLRRWGRETQNFGFINELIRPP